MENNRRVAQNQGQGFRRGRRCGNRRCENQGNDFGRRRGNGFGGGWRNK